MSANPAEPSPRPTKTKRIAILIIASLLAAIAIVVIAVLVGQNLGERYGGDRQNALYSKYGDADAYRKKVEQTTTQQLQPLVPHLTGMGFEDPAKLDTTCEYTRYEAPDPSSFEDSWVAPGDHFECSSGIDRFVKLPTDKAAYIAKAGELDKTLMANGWRLESETATTDWFGKLKNGVEAPGDQSYTKTVDDIDCSLSFWAAFSDPDPPAASVQVSCGVYD